MIIQRGRGVDVSTRRLTERLKNLADLERRLPFRVMRLGKLLESQSAGLLADHDIDPTGFRVLLFAKIFGRISTSDLARIMVIDRDRVARAVARVRNRGWLSTIKDQDDRRQNLITLTAEGEAILTAVEPLFDQRRELLAAQLTSSELAAFRSAIAKLTGFLDGGLEFPVSKFPEES